MRKQPNLKAVKCTFPSRRPGLKNTSARLQAFRAANTMIRWIRHRKPFTCLDRRPVLQTLRPFAMGHLGGMSATKARTLGFLGQCGGGPKSLPLALAHKFGGKARLDFLPPTKRKFGHRRGGSQVPERGGIEAVTAPRATSVRSGATLAKGDPTNA